MIVRRFILASAILVTPRAEAREPVKIEFNEGKAAYLACLKAFHDEHPRLDRAVHDKCRFNPPGSQEGRLALVGYSFPDIVTAVLEALAPDFAACRAAGKSSAGAGSARISFFVYKNGEVDKVVFGPETKDPKDVQACMTARFKEVGLPHSQAPSGNQINDAPI